MQCHRPATARQSAPGTQPWTLTLLQGHWHCRAPRKALRNLSGPETTLGPTFSPVMKTCAGDSGLGAALLPLEAPKHKTILGREAEQSNSSRIQTYRQPSIARNTMSRSGVSFLPSSWEATRSLLSGLDSLQRRLSVRRQSSLSRWDFCQGLGRALLLLCNQSFTNRSIGSLRSSFSHCWDMQLCSICSRQYMAIAFAPETLLQKPQRAPTASFITGFPYHHCRKSSFTSASPVAQTSQDPIPLPRSQEQSSTTKRSRQVQGSHFFPQGGKKKIQRILLQHPKSCLAATEYERGVCRYCHGCTLP